MTDKTAGVPPVEPPPCAVRGLIQRGAMCSQIIVGGKLCGYSGKCEHQRATPIDADEPDDLCLHCRGDGMDQDCDYLLPCPDRGGSW